MLVRGGSDINLGHLEDRKIQIYLEDGKHQGSVGCRFSDSVVVKVLEEEEDRKLLKHHPSFFLTLPSHM